MLTSGLGSRGRLVALSCAVACAAVAAAWQQRARRRAAASRRAGCSSVHNALASVADGDDSCDAPGLLAAFQVRPMLAQHACCSRPDDPTASRWSRTPHASPLVTPRTARTSSGCSCTHCTSRPPWVLASRRRRHASTSLHALNGATARCRAPHAFFGAADAAALQGARGSRPVTLAGTMRWLPTFRWSAS